MRRYENEVQKIKSDVYKKVSQYAFDGTLTEMLPSIALELNKGPNPSLRCCVYHERAVTNERIQMSLGGDAKNPNLVEVLQAACDQCKDNRYMVTESCRGCLSHWCQQSCPVNAIEVINHQAIINYDLCVECGKCHNACPYNAISDVLRPCIKVCPTGAITVDENKKAKIDEEKCIRCGACVYHCPFGAVQDKSQIITLVNALKKETSNIYAIIAPAIATQFDYINLGQLVTAMKTIGFKDVIEVALGADMVAINEANEFLERLMEGQQVMTTSCCPGFVRYIHQEFPEVIPMISDTVSPMIATARFIRSIDKDSQIAFIGPCIAKKGEADFFELYGEVDYVLTFEELTGIIDAKEIDLSTVEPSPLNNASTFGRGFASSGGVAKAVEKVIKEKSPDEVYDVLVCDGIDECKKALTLAKLGKLKKTLIEGMACKGGCIKGPVTMHYGPGDKKKLVAYCKEAYENNSIDATKVFDHQPINLHR